ncbi:glycosyltransferase family 2 protein [Aeromicrobium sp. A1-2]|uniref:glycosyltransferase family 2 protein n=1 Tax=Aeromicrobium sp. A1-2 TaxID=2107713 RepID=UPI0013C2F80F|nr:glycosyltransferase [Aeromicrobium sp. A1-2]
MDETSTTRHWLDDPPTVGAVLVAHNGATWLPKVLGSFSHMFHAPLSWRVVDVSSTDGSADLLRDSFGADRITYAPSGTGFGDAVRLALESMPRTDWIWLLHDDALVLPGTLSGLLDTATSAPDIAAVGPKIREWPSLRRLLEVGLTITSTGSRETGLETGEPDAGQHDRSRDVLAVNTAGMLIRRDVWDELGGLDPNLPLFFDDIDLGWRIARAGYRTLTAPTAVIFHAEATGRGTRSRTAGDVPHWEPRRAALYTMLANTPMPRFLWQYVRLFLGSLLRVVGMVIGKDPESAGDELLALRSVYLHPVKLARARRARRETARRSHRSIRDLFAPYWLPYQHGFDVVRETVAALVKPESIETVGRRSTTLDQAPDEAVDLDDGPSMLQRRPWLAAVLALMVLSLVAGRGLLSGNLHGGALPPSPDSVTGWWHLALAGQQAVGLPSDILPPAFALPLAVAATPVWFAPGLVVTMLMVFAVPLAALTAHRFGRQISPHRIPRIVWAVSYALCVVATGAVSQGRIGTVVVLIVLPIIANTGWQLAENPGWQLALRLGIWIALASAFAPIVLVMSFGGLLVLWYAEGRWVRRQIAIAAGVPLLLLGPWLAQRTLRPWRAWWEAGYPFPGSATVRDVVLGRAGGSGGAPEWLTVGLLVLALVALVPRSTRSGVIIAWLVALLGLAAALVGTLVTYSTQAGPADITPWVGVPVVVWVGGLLTAVLLAVPAAMSWPRPALAAAVVVALVLPIGTGVWWLGRGMDYPIRDGRTSVVPVFLAERPGDTLILTGTIEGGVNYRVVASNGPFLGQEAVVASAGDSRQLTAVTRRILAQATSADIEALSGLGIDAIYAPRADPELTRRIDAAPMLQPAGSDQPGSRVWTLAADPDLTSSATPWWHRGIVVLQILAWLVAIILTAPVRKRAAPAVLGDGETEDDT